MISTPSQIKNVYETVRTINNRELYDTLRWGFEANYKVYELSFELINSLMYSSAVTLKQYLNDTTLKHSNERMSTEPKWVVQFTTKINRIRRDIAHIELIQKCKQTNSYTANQKKNT